MSTARSVVLKDREGNDCYPKTIMSNIIGLGIALNDGRHIFYGDGLPSITKSDFGDNLLVDDLYIDRSNNNISFYRCSVIGTTYLVWEPYGSFNDINMILNLIKNRNIYISLDLEQGSFGNSTGTNTFSLNTIRSKYITFDTDETINIHVSSGYKIFYGYLDNDDVWHTHGSTTWFYSDTEFTPIPGYKYKFMIAKHPNVNITDIDEYVQNVYLYRKNILALQEDLVDMFPLQTNVMSLNQQTGDVIRSFKDINLTDFSSGRVKSNSSVTAVGKPIIFEDSETWKHTIINTRVNKECIITYKSTASTYFPYVVGIDKNNIITEIYGIPEDAGEHTVEITCLPETMALVINGYQLDSASYLSKVKRKDYTTLQDQITAIDPTNIIYDMLMADFNSAEFDTMNYNRSIFLYL